MGIHAFASAAVSVARDTVVRVPVAAIVAAMRVTVAGAAAAPSVGVAMRGRGRGPAVVVVAGLAAV